MNFRFILTYGLLSLIVLVRIVLTPTPKPFADGTKVSSHVRVISTPQVIGNTKQLPITLQGRKVTLVISRFTPLEYGDVVEIAGTVKTTMLKSTKDCLLNLFSKVRVIQNDPWLPFRIAAFVRGRVRDGFFSFLSTSQANLLMGIVLVSQAQWIRRA